jgi:hypothetical protein
MAQIPNIGSNPNWGMELAALQDQVVMPSMTELGSVARRLDIYANPMTTTHTTLRFMVTAGLLTRPVLATGVRCALSSSSASDASGANSGISKVLVEYLDTTGKYQTETVTLQGQTKVTMAALLCGRILQLTGTSGGSSFTVNSNAGAAGTIYCYDMSDTVASGVPATMAKRFATIPTGYTKGTMAAGCVPRGKQHTIARIHLELYDSAARYAWFRFGFKTPAMTMWAYKPILALSSAANTSGLWEPRFPLVLPELTDWEVSGLASAAGPTIIGEVEYIETTLTTV